MRTQISVVQNVPKATDATTYKHAAIVARSEQRLV